MRNTLISRAPGGRRTGAAALGLGLTLGAGLLMAPAAEGHGYTDQPISRQKLCQTKAVADCGPIQWEPQSVEGYKGFPRPDPPTARSARAGTASSPSSTTRAAAPGRPPR